MKYLLIILLLISCDKPNYITESELVTAKGGGHGKPKPKPPPVISLPYSLILATPIPANQGNEFACTPFSCVRNARSIEQYYKTQAASFNDALNTFSVEYVYDQTKAGSCSAGTSITSCLDLMYNKGVCLEATMPYSDTNGCDLIPTAAQDSEAALYKISGYSRVVNTDSLGIKNLLINHHPIMVNIIIDNGFIAATSGYIYSASTATDGQSPHCVCLIGYDNGKHAYLIVNSWGTSWGDGGYTWIDYDFFPTKAGYYLYVIN